MSIVSSCGSPAQSDADSTEQNTQTTAEAVTSSYISGLPEADYDGYEFKILGEKMRDYYFSEEQNGEVINDAVFDRNRLVEDRYNIKLNFNVVDWGKGKTEIEQMVMAGENYYDLLTSTNLYLGNAVINSYFCDWNDIPNVDLSKPYYVSSANEMYSIGDKTMLMFGDFMESTMLCSWVYVYNKKLADEYGITGLYDTVKSGTWTIDYFTSLIKDIRKDLNGDSKYDQTDFYGFGTDKYGAVDSYVRAFGLSAISKDKDNYPQLDFYKESTVDAYKKIYDLYYNTVGVYSDFEAFKHTTDMFVLGNCIFSNNLMITLLGAEMREMKDDYGVLPYPKLTENQEGYYTYLDGTFSAQMVAVTQPEADRARTGMITEALNAYAREYVVPAVYDTSLKLKASRDDDSVEMLDIILDGRRYSFDSFDEQGFALSPAKVLRSNIRSGSESISSYYDSVKTSCQSWIDTMIETYKNSEQ